MARGFSLSTIFVLAAYSVLLHLPPSAIADGRDTCPQCAELNEVYLSAKSALDDLQGQLDEARADIKEYEDQWKKGTPPQTWGQTSAELKAAEEAAAGRKLAMITDVRQAYADRIESLTKRLDKQKAYVDVVAGKLASCKKQCQANPNDIRNVGLGGEGSAIPFVWNGPYRATCEKCQPLAERLNGFPAAADDIMTLMFFYEDSIAKMKHDRAMIRATFDAERDQKFVDDVDERIISHAGSLWDNEYLTTEHEVAKKQESQRNDRKAERKKLEQQNAERIELEKDRKRWARSKLDVLDRGIRDAEAELRKQKGALRLLTSDFEKTYDAFNHCMNACLDQKEAKAAPTKCSYSHRPVSITVGPNDKVGSSAEFKNNITEKAKNTALGALGSLFGGGSGISLGGGGDDSAGASQKGPELDDDPTQGAFVEGAQGGIEYGVRADFTKDGKLAISYDLDDVPGDGTFHVQWLEDGNGTVYLPTDYLILSLYQDWNLTVWWTYDRWVNGEHVEHREGEEVTVGRNELGSFLVRFEGEKGVENSIWHSRGFETAVKGIQRLGTLYDIPDEVLSGSCPLRLVNHVTLPKEDPVKTVPLLAEIPMLGEAFKNSEMPQDRNLTVFLKPDIVRDADR